MSTEIQQLEAHHIEQVQAVWREAGLQFRDDGRDSVAHLTRELEEGTAFLVGAVSGNALVGVVLGTDDGRKGWINRLAILPDHRRDGLAHSLIAACEEEFRRRGIGIAAGLVEGHNEGGKRLFESAGFATHDVAYFRKPLLDWEH